MYEILVFKTEENKVVDIIDFLSKKMKCSVTSEVTAVGDKTRIVIFVAADPIGFTFLVELGRELEKKMIINYSKY